VQPDHGSMWRYRCVVDVENKDVQKHNCHQHDECGDRSVYQLQDPTRLKTSFFWASSTTR
jgi:hypothetical protein